MSTAKILRQIFNLPQDFCVSKNCGRDEAARLIDPSVELDENCKEALNRKIMLSMRRLQEQPNVMVVLLQYAMTLEFYMDLSHNFNSYTM